MIIDLSEQITQAQIAFGLGVIAFLLAWIALVRTPGSSKSKKK